MKLSSFFINIIVLLFVMTNMTNVFAEDYVVIESISNEGIASLIQQSGILSNYVQNNETRKEALLTIGQENYGAFNVLSKILEKYVKHAESQQYINARLLDNTGDDVYDFDKADEIIVKIKSEPLMWGPALWDLYKNVDYNVEKLLVKIKAYKKLVVKRGGIPFARIPTSDRKQFMMVWFTKAQADYLEEQGVPYANFWFMLVSWTEQKACYVGSMGGRFCTDVDDEIIARYE